MHIGKTEDGHIWENNQRQETPRLGVCGICRDYVQPFVECTPQSEIECRRLSWRNPAGRLPRLDHLKDRRPDVRDAVGTGNGATSGDWRCAWMARAGESLDPG
jgi:hypothetical protein